MNYEGLLKLFAAILPVAAIFYYQFDDDSNKGIYTEQPLNGIVDELLYGCCRLVLSLNAAFFFLVIGGGALMMIGFSLSFLGVLTYASVAFLLGIPIQ